MLAQPAVYIRVAQDHMRHSDINLTMNYYAHTTLDSKADAVNKLPNFKSKHIESKEVMAIAGA